MKVFDFRPEHADLIEWQSAQKQDAMHTNPQLLAVSGEAYTAVDDDDKVLLCGGLAQVWEGRWILWAIMSQRAGSHMLRIVRGVKRFLDAHEGAGRVEVIVRSDFTQGHRMATMLGMSYHHHEERFLPGEVDADIYVRFI